MSRDVVDRLRDWARLNGEWISIAPAATEAADEIETLRSALRDLLGELEGCDLTFVDEEAMAPAVDRARQALGPSSQVAP